MSLRSRMTTWWRAISRADALDHQLHEELKFHIDSCAEDMVRQGVPREEALRRARAELGSLPAVHENSRQAWGTRFLDELRGDLRFAIRVLARSPGFTAIAIGSLALGIGANTAIFTAAQHMLLDRLDVPHPEQLRLFGWTAPRNGVVESLWGQWDDLPGGGMVSTSFSFPVYLRLRRENRSLADVFAFKGFGRMVATVDGHAQT
ncbi:MAG TPA: permease prefix domain 1-containing protein, partial [Acidobacteriaceae bacterium]|nr:permease prefix domain 1-containing protein [Acidobacteriaceae bacterium]